MSDRCAADGCEAEGVTLVGVARLAPGTPFGWELEPALLCEAHAVVSER